MRLSRRTKARVMAYVNPQRLLWVTMGLGVFALAWHLVAFAALLFDIKINTWLAGFIFLPMVGVHMLRWAALARGWAPVRTGDLSLLAEFFPDPDCANTDGNDPAMPARLEVALAEAIHRKGWLAWSDAMDLAREHGVGDQTRQWVFLMGGVGTPVARRTDWKKHLNERAWLAGRMGRKFDRHTLTVAKPRTRF